VKGPDLKGSGEWGSLFSDRTCASWTGTGDTSRSPSLLPTWLAPELEVSAVGVNW